MKLKPPFKMRQESKTPKKTWVFNTGNSNITGTVLNPPDVEFTDTVMGDSYIVSFHKPLRGMLHVGIESCGACIPSEDESPTRTIQMPAIEELVLPSMKPKKSFLNKIKDIFSWKKKK